MSAFADYAATSGRGPAWDGDEHDPETCNCGPCSRTLRRWQAEDRADLAREARKAARS